MESLIIFVLILIAAYYLQTALAVYFFINHSTLQVIVLHISYQELSSYIRVRGETYIGQQQKWKSTMARWSNGLTTLP